MDIPLSDFVDALGGFLVFWHLRAPKYFYRTDADFSLGLKKYITKTTSRLTRFFEMKAVEGGASIRIRNTVGNIQRLGEMSWIVPRSGNCRSGDSSSG